MRQWLQHRLNSAHIYCRLRDCGAPRGLAALVASLLGWFARPAIYRKPGRLPAVLALLLLLSGCNTSWMQGIGLKVGPAGVMLTYNSPQFGDQLRGVGSWAEWLASAPENEVVKHMPGVKAWVDQLATAAKGAR